jgi:hypothetical protein
MSNNKFNIILFVSIFVGCIIFVALQRPSIQKNHDIVLNFMYILDTSEINGRLTFVKRDHERHFDLFGVSDHPGITYSIPIFIHYENKILPMVGLADVGDSIIKHAHSNKVILINKNRVYYGYTFNK